MKKNKTMVEIWQDVVEIKDLIRSIILSFIFTFGVYLFVSPNNKAKELFFGLVGAVMGFVITNVFIKPKRIIIFDKNKIKE
ncbi:MAG: hypothetical protein GX069_00775 [Tissierellia bacterium]|nr:hypothetical protein [Tissierellia bacterium]